MLTKYGTFTVEALGAGARMKCEVLVVLDHAVFDDDIVADLP